MMSGTYGQHSRAPKQGSRRAPACINHLRDCRPGVTPASSKPRDPLPTAEASPAGRRMDWPARRSITDVSIMFCLLALCMWANLSVGCHVKLASSRPREAPRRDAAATRRRRRSSACHACRGLSHTYPDVRQRTRVAMCRRPRNMQVTSHLVDTSVFLSDSTDFFQD